MPSKLTAVQVLTEFATSDFSDDKTEENAANKEEQLSVRQQPGRKAKELFLADNKPKPSPNPRKKQKTADAGDDRFTRAVKESIATSSRDMNDEISFIGFAPLDLSMNKTPEHFQQEKRQRSPMDSAEQANGNDSDDDTKIRTKAVRKSLQDEFSKLSPEKPKIANVEVIPAKENVLNGNGKANHAADGDDENSEEEDEKVAFAQNQIVLMNQLEVQNIMSKLEDPWKSRKEYLLQKYRKQFPEWHLKLRMGLNIVFHGVGSKKNLLEAFRQEQLSKEPVFVVEGYKPSCNLKMIFSSFHTTVLQQSPPKDPQEVIQNIGEYILKNFAHFTLLIHNIDGQSLRNFASQHLLSTFATLKNVHVVASTDHPNLPLLWTEKDRTAFKWIYHHVPTFAYYSEFPLPDLAKSGAESHDLALSSLEHVFESLTQNAKRIYQEIAKYHVNREEDALSKKDGTGMMSYKELYKICRSSFFVSTEPALRKQLVEFYDHNLLRNHRGADGLDYLTIPIAKNVLQEFLAKVAD